MIGAGDGSMCKSHARGSGLEKTAIVPAVAVRGLEGAALPAIALILLGERSVAKMMQCSFFLCMQLEVLVPACRPPNPRLSHSFL